MRGGAGFAGAAAFAELAARLEADRARPAEELRRRDREIGRDLAALRGDPPRQILAWLARVGGDGKASSPPRIGALLRLGALLLGLAGLVSGWLATAALFRYDGSAPVNVLAVLALFVGVQLLLLLLLGLTLLPPSLLRRLPGAAALAGVLDLLRPGRLQGLLLRRLPQEERERADALLGAGRRHRSLFGRVERWTVTLSSQLFALFFNLGALLGCLALIVFSDIAFAWSTTLQVTAGQVHTLTDLLSAPWGHLLPAAVPSPELVEATRYFRLREGGPAFPGGAGGGPELLGGWWPFLVMSMLCYGLLPRLALAWFSRWRLGRALGHAIPRLPGAADLLDRMNGELVETQSPEAEAAAEAKLEGAGEAAPSSLAGAPCALIDWGDVAGGEEELAALSRELLKCRPSALLAAGGGRTIEEDSETAREAARLRGGGAVVIFVRAWEPPLEEFLDFLRELRQAAGPETDLTVVPVSAAGASSPRPGERGVWRGRLATLGDARLRVESPVGEAEG